MRGGFVLMQFDTSFHHFLSLLTGFAGSGDSCAAVLMVVSRKFTVWLISLGSISWSMISRRELIIFLYLG